MATVVGKMLSWRPPEVREGAPWSQMLLLCPIREELRINPQSLDLFKAVSVECLGLSLMGVGSRGVGKR